jgi:hypothetical protein
MFRNFLLLLGATVFWSMPGFAATDSSELSAVPQQPVKEDLPSGEHSQSRAGCPLNVAWYARPSDTAAYVGYYVGGGCAWRGQPRTPAEGTWGWDYRGLFFLRRVGLNWCHCGRYQGGIGHYRTVPTPNPSSPSTP